MKHFHILQKTNTLLTFDIVRKIKESDIKKIKKEIDFEKIPKKLRKREFENRLKIFTDKAISKEPVPGIINFNKINDQKIEYLLKNSIEIAKEIKKLNLNKEEESFLIVSLTKILELGIEDFKKWQKRQQEMNEDVEEDDDGDLEDYEE